jgi:hypothetical protein
MSLITTKELYEWCKIPYDKLPDHLALKQKLPANLQNLLEQ